MALRANFHVHITLYRVGNNGSAASASDGSFFTFGMYSCFHFNTSLHSYSFYARQLYHTFLSFAIVFEKYFDFFFYFLCSLIFTVKLNLFGYHNPYSDEKGMYMNLKGVLYIVAGTVLLAFGSAIFILPFNLVAGGITGISIVIKNLFPSLTLSKDIIIFILSWSAFFIGLIILGKNFALKTLISTAVYPVFLYLFTRLASEDIFGGIFYLQGSLHQETVLIVSALSGAVIIGAGCALTFLGGGSTGGVDIIAFIICKYVPRIKSSTAILVIDCTTVALGLFALGDLVLSLLGIFSAFITSVVIDKIFLGRTQAFVAAIISKEHNEIKNAIIERLNRTATITDATGGYSNDRKKVISVTFSIRQYAELLSIISSIDKSAFVTVTRAHEINGEGWSR